jgi:hypothetical protein
MLPAGVLRAGKIMKWAVILGVLMAAAGVSASEAADISVWRQRAAPATPVYVFRVPPRSPQAQTVWASDACWRGCEQQCGWRYQICLGLEGQGECMAQTDACDRSCQGQCRIYGGPLLNLAN